MNEIKVDKVTPHDIERLQAIARDTFSEAFSNTNTEEDMQHYLDTSFSVSKLAGEVGNTLSQFYFATVNGNVVGYLKINTGQAQTEVKDNSALEIERIYVLKAYHGKKVAQALYNKAIAIAAEMNAGYVWLGVWERNARAISFYTKNGFVPFDQHVFKLGTDEQIDIMMKKLL